MPPRPRDPTGPRQGTEPELVVQRVHVEQFVDETAGGDASAGIDVSAERPPRPAPRLAAEATAGIDIRWTDDGACVVELRGRPSRATLAKARDLLWSRSPQDRLTIVVSDAVLTRELFAMLIAGRRRLSASGVLEIVGLDAPGARRIADSLQRPPPSPPPP